ncbi:MAG: glycosyltransferase family 4 protein [Acidobacteriia bacterium]|nr:glycosyltransferase family 4 protein [Terriglobia bacterium]
MALVTDNFNNMLTQSGSERPKIAYVNESDPRDKRSWSGIHHFMARALQRHCGPVSFIAPLFSKMMKYGQFLNDQSQRILNKKYDYTHSTLLSRSYGSIIERRILGHHFDLIFAPEASTEIASLETNIPIIYLSDVTFALINEYYSSFSNFLPISVWEGNRIERLAIKKARRLLYPTEWAAKSAIRDYHADTSKIHVIPFGANLAEVPPREQVLGRTQSDHCRLLFLGVEWERKGGELAFETMLRLQELGIEVELIVCGCTPPDKFRHNKMVVIPFLDKNDAKNSKRLDDLFFTADILLLPGREEAFGIVFCEAAAFGLPVVTSDTGGVSEVVKPGENGILLPRNARAEDYAKEISRIYRDQQTYSALVYKSRSAFESRLNWDAWGLEVKKVIAEIL